MPTHTCEPAESTENNFGPKFDQVLEAQTFFVENLFFATIHPFFFNSRMHFGIRNQNYLCGPGFKKFDVGLFLW